MKRRCRQTDAGKNHYIIKINKFNLFFVLIFFLTPRGILFSEKYQGRITEDLPRVRDVMRIIKLHYDAKDNPPPAGTILPDIPSEFTLRYSRMVNWIYLSFYDIEGREIFFQFRKIRWDDRGDRILNRMIPGDVYRIRGQFAGIWFRGRFFSGEGPDIRKIITDHDSIPVYSFSGAEQTASDFILF